MRMIQMSAGVSDGDMVHAWTAPGSSSVMFNFGALMPDGSLRWGTVDVVTRNPATSVENTIRHHWLVTGPITVLCGGV